MGIVRKTLSETWDFLENEGHEAPRDSSGAPFVPKRMPSFGDDETLGFSFFREEYADSDLSHLTIPRTFFGRSLIESVSFVGSDLSESRMCWNNVLSCDFSDADLTGCDLRASRFENCRFHGTVLRGVDLRYSSWSGCDFAGAEWFRTPGALPRGG